MAEALPTDRDSRNGRAHARVSDNIRRDRGEQAGRSSGKLWKAQVTATSSRLSMRSTAGSRNVIRREMPCSSMVMPYR